MNKHIWQVSDYRQFWQVSDYGFIAKDLPTGYYAELKPVATSRYELTVKHGDTVILHKISKRQFCLNAVLDFGMHWTNAYIYRSERGE